MNGKVMHIALVKKKVGCVTEVNLLEAQKICTLVS